MTMTRQEYIGRFYAEFYFWVNLTGACLQMFVVSRVMKYVGIGPTLFLLPMVALGGYTFLSFAPVLSVFVPPKLLKTAPTIRYKTLPATHCSCGQAGMRN